MIQLSEHKSECTGCHACANSCPVNAISMKADEEGFLYPKVDRQKCIRCGRCTKVCHIGKEKLPAHGNCTAYAAFYKDQNVREKSSSGGMFSALAQKILSDGGVVAGAAMTAEGKGVEHRIVVNEGEMDLLRGSKYVQSRIGAVYSRIEERLKQGGIVYFSGTPCQIDGLYRYLGKDYDQLYTQDLICHGVPSPLVWHKYAEELEQSEKAKIQQVSFRNKKYGWKNFSMQVRFANGKEQCKDLRTDSYLKGFLSDTFLRPSCHQCKYKEKHRSADITLADLWGAAEICPEMDDDRGLSLIIVHSEKGKALIEAIREETVLVPVDMDTVLRYNSAAIRSSKPAAFREAFMQKLPGTTYRNLFKKYIAEKKTARVKRKVKSFAKKILGVKMVIR